MDKSLESLVQRYRYAYEGNEVRGTGPTRLTTARSHTTAHDESPWGGVWIALAILLLVLSVLFLYAIPDTTFGERISGLVIGCAIFLTGVLLTKRA